MKEETREYIDKEFGLLVDELRAIYEASGKKVTGRWGEGLEVVREGNKTILKGYGYLSGRSAGKMPPIKEILNWVKSKGIFEYRSNEEASSIAWAIAVNIAKNGTNSQYELDIYPKVITPLRIQQILDGVMDLEKRIYVNEVVLYFNNKTKDLWR